MNKILLTMAKKKQTNNLPYEVGMMYDPNKTLSDLILYDEFRVDFGIDKEKFLKFVVLVYDINSPMRNMYVDLWERKRATAIMVGFKVDESGKFESDVEAMLVGENMECNKAISKYVVIQGIPEYTALVALQTSLHCEMLKVQKGVANQNVTKNIILLQNNIKSNTEYLFGGEEPLNLRQALYGIIEKDRFPLPDEVVRRIADGDKLDDYNPYGDYKVDELKFIGDE